ncbi:DUF3108 domain-containing protein [Pyrinomonas sp.]|uniref:DUF3108 domain-containing protein n=1 Tax=Pyrinomonas sp. TaxID=2080306 RepID=UPI0033196217
MAGNEKFPFLPQEELIYEGEFSKLVLRNINIAEFRFVSQRAPSSCAGNELASLDALTTPLRSVCAASEPPLLFTGEAHAVGWFHRLFGIDFQYKLESRVEASSFNVIETKKYDQQGSRVRVGCATFDRNNGRLTWTEHDPRDPTRAPNVVTNRMGGAPLYDLLTAIYYLRTKRFVPGEQLTLVISDAGRTYNVPVRALEIKRLKTVLGEVETVHLDVGLFGPTGLVQRNGHMSLWITTDGRHLPVRAEMSSDLGTLTIKLKRISHNAGPTAGTEPPSAIKCGAQPASP